MASSSFPRPALQVHPTRGRRGPVGWSGLRAEPKEVVGQLGQLVVVPRHPPQHGSSMGRLFHIVREQRLHLRLPLHHHHLHSLPPLPLLLAFHIGADDCAL